MMLNAKEHYSALYHKVSSFFSASSPSWLTYAQDQAFQTFCNLGFPSRSQERWRHPSTEIFENNSFFLPLFEKINPVQIPTDINMTQGYQLVFSGGHYRPELSNVTSLPEGVIIMSLRQALIHFPLEVKALFSDTANTPFSAFNMAFMSDGFFIKIKQGVHLQDPIQCIFLDNAHHSHEMVHYRHHIILEQGAFANVVEHYLSADHVTHLTNVVSSHILMKDAALKYHKLQNENNQSYHMSAQHVHQAVSSHYESILFSLGCRLSRHEAYVQLRQAHAHCAMSGFSMLHDDQQADIYVNAHHQQASGVSQLFFKSVAKDKAKSVFNGTVIVDKNAVKTKSAQRNQNFLLSNTAEIYTKPELEIYTDDVECTHSATVGELHEEALFYLLSRGISEEAARALLIKAFSEDVLEKVTLAHLRFHASSAITAKLQEREAAHALLD